VEQEIIVDFDIHAIYVFKSSLNPSAISRYLSGIEHLDGTNFSWLDQILITFGLIDLDYALREKLTLST
jgi:hypothetical protein